MKRVVLAAVVILMAASLGYSAETPAVTTYATEKITVDGRPTRVVITASWTAGSLATAPTFTIDPDTYGIRGWYLYSVETDPGTTAPTDNYDLVINDSNGIDVCWGLLANRSTSATQQVNCATSGHSYPVVRSTLTPVLTNNSVNSATGVIIFTFVAN